MYGFSAMLFTSSYKPLSRNANSSCRGRIRENEKGNINTKIERVGSLRGFGAARVCRMMNGGQTECRGLGSSSPHDNISTKN